MKLYNKSKLPDEVLEPLLTAAGRAVGARTANVVVKVTQGKRRLYGMAQGMAFVNTWHLKRVKNWKRERVTTDGGYYRLTIPVHPRRDPAVLAEAVFKVAMHEWVHIRDFQAREALPWAHAGISGRRPRHDSRPEELRAIDAVDDAVQAGVLQRHRELLVRFTLAYENLLKPVLKGAASSTDNPVVSPVQQAEAVRGFSSQGL